MIPFFVVFETIMIILRVIAGYFADSVPILGALQTPLTWICVIVGIIAVAVIAVRIYNEVKRK